MRTSDTSSTSLEDLFRPTEPDHTPDDSAECVFLGRAYHQLARAIDPEWTGRELTATLPELLPDAIQPYRTLLDGGAADENNIQAEWYEPPRRATLEYAYYLLHTARPDLRPKPRAPRFFGSYSDPPPRFTLFEWKEAQEINRFHRELVQQSLDRKRRVDKTICELCEAGVLRTRLRQRIGGDYSPTLPVAHWRTESYGERFTKWRMNPQNPFSTYGELHFIFVERASLTVALERLRSGAAGDQQLDGFVSDQISFLLRTASKCRVTADNPCTIEAIKMQIEQDWPWEDPPGKTELNYMASFVRNRSAREAPWKRRGRAAKGKPKEKARA